MLHTYKLKNEDFYLKDINATAFKDFKLPSPQAKVTLKPLSYQSTSTNFTSSKSILSEYGASTLHDASFLKLPTTTKTDDCSTASIISTYLLF